MLHKVNIEIKNGIPSSFQTSELDVFNEYPLREVSRAELFQLRLEGAPGLVCKYNDKLFYTAIPGDLRIAGQDNNFGPHMCGRNCANVCRSCRRTADLTVSYQERLGKDLLEAIHNSWRIDKYPFIQEGIEAFNMESSYDAFLVFNCENYTCSKPTKR